MNAKNASTRERYAGLPRETRERHVRTELEHFEKACREASAAPLLEARARVDIALGALTRVLSALAANISALEGRLERIEACQQSAPPHVSAAAEKSPSG